MKRWRAARVTSNAKPASLGAEEWVKWLARHASDDHETLARTLVDWVNNAYLQAMTDDVYHTSLPGLARSQEALQRQYEAERLKLAKRALGLARKDPVFCAALETCLPRGADKTGEFVRAYFSGRAS